MKLRILSANDLEQVLTMRQCVDLMRRAFIELSADQVKMPQRLHVEAEEGTTLVMPALLQQSGEFCVKVVSVFPRNAEQNLPAVPGLAMVLDVATGMPRALVDGHALTLWRSGAAGGLSAELLARSDATSVAVIGAGGQARAQLRGVMAVRPIDHVSVFSRTIASAEKLKQEVETWTDHPHVEVIDNPESAVRDADIVIAATNSSTPVFEGDALQDGTHVIAIGSFRPSMRELDIRTVQRSRIVVDHRASALSEAGELIASGVTSAVEIGEVAAGRVPGRQHDEEITLFKSVGVAVQDAAASRYAADEAERLGLGTVAEL